MAQKGNQSFHGCVSSEEAAEMGGLSAASHCSALPSTGLQQDLYTGILTEGRGLRDTVLGDTQICVAPWS